MFSQSIFKICIILTHFAQNEKFSQAVASDGFFEDKDKKIPLEKAVNTARKLNLLHENDVNLIYLFFI